MKAKVGIGVIVRRDNEILLLKRQNSHGHGTWSCPGGHIEFGETFEQCARRECFEETGIAIDHIVFKTITNDIFEREGKHYVTLWMEAEYLSGEACINAPDELTEVAWYDWNELPENLFLPMVNLLKGDVVLK